MSEILDEVLSRATPCPKCRVWVQAEVRLVDALTEIEVGCACHEVMGHEPEDVVQQWTAWVLTQNDHE